MPSLALLALPPGWRLAPFRDGGLLAAHPRHRPVSVDPGPALLERLQAAIEAELQRARGHLTLH